jgi:SdpI/YfhL protein family
LNQLPPLGRDILAGLCLGVGGLMHLWRMGPNGWIGVRTPWTFADRYIWDRSWTMAALLAVGMGLAALWSLPLFFAVAFATIALSILYPLYLYRRKYGTWRYWKDIGWNAYRPAVRCDRCGHIERLNNADELAVARCRDCGASLWRPFA